MASVLEWWSGGPMSMSEGTASRGRSVAPNP